MPRAGDADAAERPDRRTEPGARILIMNFHEFCKDFHFRTAASSLLFAGPAVSAQAMSEGAVDTAACAHDAARGGDHDAERPRESLAAERKAECESSAELPIGLVECPICLTLLCEPVTTPCGHTFCRPCLVSTLRRNMKKCPSCRS